MRNKVIYVFPDSGCLSVLISDSTKPLPTVNFLNIRTPKKIVVITLKVELCCSTIE